MTALYDFLGCRSRDEEPAAVRRGIRYETDVICRAFRLRYAHRQPDVFPLRTLRVHRAVLHGNNNLALMPFPRDCALAASLTSLELSACSMFSLPAQVQPPHIKPHDPVWLGS